MLPIERSSDVSLDPTVHAHELDPALGLVEKPRLLGPVGEQEHRHDAEQDCWDAFDDEEQSPICYCCVSLLYAEGD